MSEVLKRYISQFPVDDLKKMCRNLDLSGFSRMKKAELVQLVCRTLHDPSALFQCLWRMKVSVWPLFWKVMTSNTPVIVARNGRIESEWRDAFPDVLDFTPGILIFDEQNREGEDILAIEMEQEIKDALSLLNMAAMDALKQFQSVLSRYGNASVNLYGVLSMKEFLTVLKRYEPKRMKDPNLPFFIQSCAFEDEIVDFWTKEGQHPFVPYDGEQVFSIPNIMDPMEIEPYCTLEMLIILSLFSPCRLKNTSYGVNGNMIYSIRFLGDEDDLYPDDESKEFIQECIDARKGKKQYIPNQAEFLHYEDILYYEETPQVKQFDIFVLDLLRNRSNKNQDQDFLKLEDMELSDRFYEYHTYEELEANITKAITTKALENLQCEARPADSMKDTLEMLDRFGIRLTDDQLETFIKLFTNMANHYRRWDNYGCSPSECISIMSGSEQQSVIRSMIRGTNKGKVPDALLQKLLMDAIFATDENAPSSSNPLVFSNGSGTKVTLHSEGISRNQLCPCGSGKKYKHCCGKKN